MRFVDDIDLRAGLGARRVHRALAQVARVIDAAVGSGVELHDVEIGGTGPNAAARIAHPAGFAAGRPLLAIQRHREDPGRRGLPYAARTGKKVAVGHPALEERVGPRRLLVHVRVERVAGERGEVLDVLQRHQARARDDRVAYPQLGQ